MRALRPPAAPSCSTRSLAPAITALGLALYAARRYAGGGCGLSQKSSVLIPTTRRPTRERGLAYYGLGDLESARASCETKPDYWESQQCLAVIYDKLGRHADAEAELAKLKAAMGDSCGLPVRHDLCAVGQSGEGARMARDGAAAAGSGPRVSEDRSAPGPLAQRAALPGRDAGIEVSGLNYLSSTLRCSTNRSPATKFDRPIPVTWLTVYTGDMVDTLALKGFGAHSTRADS